MRKCSVCGTEFEAKANSQKYCSPDCMRKARRAGRARNAREWNRIFNGVDVVELELIEGEEGAADTKGASRASFGDGGREDRSWWTYGKRGK